MSKKPILSLDFDGVVHSYNSPWVDAVTIPDPPVPGALDFILAALSHFDVQIFSSRTHQDGGINAMKNWLYEQFFHAYLAADPNGNIGHAHTAAQAALAQIGFPEHKPPAFLSIDDRALCFTGQWPDPAELRNFRPWNKK